MKTFEEFIFAREEIRILKSMGAERPWTNDQILDKHHFCNIDRTNDGFSQWLIKNWYEPQKYYSTVLNAVTARWFNTPAPLEMIRTIEKYPISLKQVQAGLYLLMARKSRMFNYAAYTRFLTDDMPEVYTRILTDVLAIKDNNNGYANSFADMIQTVKGIGPFLASQITLDIIMVEPNTFFDSEDYCPIGPGSIRGLNRIIGNTLNTNLNTQTAKNHIKTWSKNLSYSPAIIEHALCEYDKYCRFVETPKGRLYKPFSYLGEKI